MKGKTTANNPDDRGEIESAAHDSEFGSPHHAPMTRRKSAIA
jgi:hypothetical protein